MTERIVIVGGGQCAAQTVDGLRRGGFEGDVVVACEEPHVPYQRPPLSKQYLAGEIDESRVALRPQSYYDERNVTLKLGVSVSAIERDHQRVLLSDDSRIDYDRLMLATGSRPRPLDLPGRELAGIHDFRTMDHVLAIRESLAPGRRLVVVGGGFIGLEVAAVATKLGLMVTVLEGAERLMPRVMPPLLSQWFETLHSGHGVRIRTNAAVQGFEGDGSVSAVQLDGESVPADIVIIGIGIVPNQELAAAADLECDDGIVVNDRCQTSDPLIYAGGDCTRHPSRFADAPLRLESVQNAMSQARIAATNLAGGDARYDELPWFWSDQYDVKLQMAGLSANHDDLVVRGDLNDSSFAVFYLRDHRLIAADVISAPRDFMAVRKILPDQPIVSREKLADPDVPVAELTAS